MNEKEICAENGNAKTELTDLEREVVGVLEDLVLIPVEGLDKQLIADLAMDSLRLVLLLVNLEETFHIELDESDMDPFQLITVRDVVNLVNKYVSGGENDE